MPTWLPRALLFYVMKILYIILCTVLLKTIKKILIHSVFLVCVFLNFVLALFFEGIVFNEQYDGFQAAIFV